MTARDDRDLSDRIGARLEHAQQSVARFVERGALSFSGEMMMRRSTPSRIFSSESVRSPFDDASCSRRAAMRAPSLMRFRRSAPTMPGVAAGEHVEIDIVCQGHTSGVDLENRLAPSLIGRVHHYLAVEAPGPEKGRVEYSRAGSSPRGR